MELGHNGLRESGENIRKVESLNEELRQLTCVTTFVFPILYKALCLPVNSSRRLGVPRWFRWRARALFPRIKNSHKTRISSYRLFLHYNAAQIFCIPFIVSDTVILYIFKFYTALLYGSILQTILRISLPSSTFPILLILDRKCNVEDSISYRKHTGHRWLSFNYHFKIWFLVSRFTSILGAHGYRAARDRWRGNFIGVR